MAKKGLDLMIALGKAGPPKSKNMSGVSDSSISAPDQSGDAMAPGGGMDEDTSPMEEGGEGAGEGGGMEEGENCITLPPGFKAPDGSEDGKPFTTTIRGKIMDGKFYAESIGDMPLKGGAAEQQSGGAADEGEEEGDDGGYAQKQADEKMAKSVFQPGR